MKTKQLIAAVVLCGPLLFTNIQAQGLYIGLDAGYGFPAAKSSGNDYKSTGTGSATTNEYTSKSYSFGKGANFGLFVGYMFNKNMGAELGVSYLMGGENLFVNESSSGSSSSKTEETVKGKMIRLTPCIRMTVGENKMKPYMKMGLIIGVGTKVTDESNSTSSGSFGNSNGQDIYEYTGGISMGFHGGIGVNFAVSDKLSIFGEIAGNYQNWAPTKSTLVTSTQNGVDQLPGMKTRDIETEYVDSYTTSNSSPTDVNSPSKSTKFYLPFSSVGINIGLVFTMGGGSN